MKSRAVYKIRDCTNKDRRFIVDSGHKLTANPNYNLFQKVRRAITSESCQAATDQVIQMYVDPGQLVDRRFACSFRRC